MEKEWGVTESCISCAHLNLNSNEYGSCKAFPNGVPFSIFSSQIDHYSVLKDQENNIIYEERKRK